MLTFTPTIKEIGPTLLTCSERTCVKKPLFTGIFQNLACLSRMGAPCGF